MRYLAIVGTAGRPPHGSRLTRRHFETIERAAMKVAHLTTCEAAVSGGAAWADHAAVTLFLDHKLQGLLLHLPCPLDLATGAYQDSGESDFIKNPGGTSNRYHKLFSERIHHLPYFTLGQIRIALSRGAVSAIGKGFKDRNTEIAKQADAILACTFGAGREVADGGTRDTWNKFRTLKPEAPAYHLDLNTCKLWLAQPQTPRVVPTPDQQVTLPFATSSHTP